MTWAEDPPGATTMILRGAGGLGASDTWGMFAPGKTRSTSRSSCIGECGHLIRSTLLFLNTSHERWPM